MKRARTSEVWKHFTVLSEENKIAICKICKQKCSFRTTISNLNKHMKSKHVGVISLSSSEQMRQIPENEIDTEDKCSDSSVWKFFTRKAEFVATCNTCNQDYSYRTSTSNLRKHWYNKHRKHLDEKPSDLSENFSDTDNSDEEQDKAVASIVTKTKSMASWKYFDPLDLEKGEATCKICDRTISYEYMSDLKQHVQDHGHEPTDSDDEFVPEVQEKTIKRKMRSKLWEFFRPTTDKMAECLMCHNLFNYGATITNLRRHLMRKHGDVAHLSKEGESKNIITYNGELYEVVNGQDDDDDAPKEMDAVYLNEEELDDDSTIYKPPTPKKKKLSIPSKFKPKITKEQIHSTKYTCSEEPELPNKPIPKYTPNSMGSLDYFGQYVVSLLKELPKTVSDQLQSELIKQILTSKMALESQTVVAKYEIVRSRNSETDTNVPEPISYTVVQSNESAEKLNEINQSAEKLNEINESGEKLNETTESVVKE